MLGPQGNGGWPATIEKSTGPLGVWLSTIGFLLALKLRKSSDGHWEP